MSIIEQFPTGDELNKYLENITFNKDLKQLHDEQLKIKQLINKLKAKENMKQWYEMNKEKFNFIMKMRLREKYYSDENYRLQVILDKKNRYFIKRYGITYEEHIKFKQHQQDEFIKNNKEELDKLNEEEEKRKIEKEKRAAWARKFYYKKNYGMTEEEYKDKLKQEKLEEIDKYKLICATKIIKKEDGKKEDAVV